MRVSGERDARIVVTGGLEYLEVERALEELAIDIVHVGLKQAVLAAVSQVRVVLVGQLGSAQFIFRENDEMVVQHANARNAG